MKDGTVRIQVKHSEEMIIKWTIKCSSSGEIDILSDKLTHQFQQLQFNQQ